VGRKLANGWGLFDMTGNIWEWCHDNFQDELGKRAVTDPVATAPPHFKEGGYDGAFKVIRGGYRAADRGPPQMNLGASFFCITMRGDMVPRPRIIGRGSIAGTPADPRGAAPISRR
jgi:hypothetical protein